MVLTHDNLKGSRFFLGLLPSPQAIQDYEYTVMMWGFFGGLAELWSKDFNSTPAVDEIFLSFLHGEFCHSLSSPLPSVSNLIQISLSQ